jgi:hypothetical protein
MLFTALEVYHRKFMDEKSKRRKKKEGFADSIIRKLRVTNFSKIEKQKLESYLNYAKQLTFQERIEEIYDRFADILPSLTPNDQGKREIHK